MDSKFYNMDDNPAGKAGAASVGTKRKRVRIAEERNESVEPSSDGVAASTAGDRGALAAAERLSASEAAARRAAARIANAEQLAKLEADDGDAAGEDVIVGGGGDADEDSDDGIEPEHAAGHDDDFGDRAAVRDKLRSAGGGSAADADSDRKGPAKKLMRVRGELREDGLEEEFNEAGDAFEPFHLRGEREDGHFDAGGNFVWKKRGGGDEDAWLAGLDAMDPRERAALQKAAAAKQRSEERAGRAAGTSGGAGSAQKRARTGTGPGGEGAAGLVGVQESKGGDSDSGSDSGSDDDDDDDGAGEGLQPRHRLRVLLTLRELMRDGETVAAALRRLSGRDAAVAGAAAKRKGSAAASGAAASADSAASAASASGSAGSSRDMASFYRLTEAADALLSGGGEPGVYSWRPVDVVDKIDDVCEELGIDPREALRGAAAAAAAALTGAAAEAGGSSVPAALSADAGSATGAVPAAAAATAAASAAASAAMAMPPDDGRQWQFRWSEDAAAEVHGPYSTSVLRAWLASGMYGPERPIYVKEVLPGGETAAGAAVVTGAGAGAAAGTAGASQPGKVDEDGDDDIFSGAGGYDVKKVASADEAAAAWKRYDAAGF